MKTGSLKTGQQEEARFQADGKKPHRRVDEELRSSASHCQLHLRCFPESWVKPGGTLPGRQSGAWECGNNWPERRRATGPFTAILLKLPIGVPRRGVTALSRRAEWAAQTRICRILSPLCLLLEDMISFTWEFEHELITSATLYSLLLSCEKEPQP